MLNAESKSPYVFLSHSLCQDGQRGVEYHHIFSTPRCRVCMIGILVCLEILLSIWWCSCFRIKRMKTSSWFCTCYVSMQEHTVIGNLACWTPTVARIVARRNTLYGVSWLMVVFCNFEVWERVTPHKCTPSPVSQRFTSFSPSILCLTYTSTVMLCQGTQVTHVSFLWAIPDASCRS